MPNRTPTRRTWLLALVILYAAVSAAYAAAGEGGGAAKSGREEPRAGAADASGAAAKFGEKREEQRISLSDFIRAGGPVGHTILFLSFVGLALVIDASLRIQSQKLVPPMLTEQLVQLARQGRFVEIQNLCRTIDCMLARIVASTFAQGRMSMAAARDVMQEQGTKEVTRLYQRVGYIGFIASIAPMLGLLGTVTGMIYSFNVLGTARGTAKPDQLAIGVAEALVTTCEGLIVAIPLMFFHSHFRDRVARIAQDASGACDRLMRTMAEGQLAFRSRPPAGEAEEEAEAPPEPPPEEDLPPAEDIAPTEDGP